MPVDDGAADRSGRGRGAPGIRRPPVRRRRWTPTPPAPAPPLRRRPTPAAGPTAGSPMRLYDTAWADYTAGNYDLAIEGFSSYVRSFPQQRVRPTTRSATSARATTSAASWPRRSTRSTASSPPIRRATSSARRTTSAASRYERLNQPDRARESFEYADQDLSPTRRRPAGQAAARRAQPRAAAVGRAARGASRTPPCSLRGRPTSWAA